LIYKPLPSDDPLQRCPDISKAKNTLNWSPKTDLVDGLAQTIDYFKSILKEEI
jgi:nucleoside-diphosphate-sugar epimerase